MPGWLQAHHWMPKMISNRMIWCYWRQRVEVHAEIDRQQTNWHPASSVAEQMMRWQPLAATKA
jgi:hypothetical protein